MTIAIIDDCIKDIEILKDFINRYKSKYNEPFEILSFSSGEEFLGSSNDLDIIFLDIEMPELDGIKTAQLIRKKDKKIPIIFQTNMANYALQSYEVHALDFIVKPITYEIFEDRFTRALEFAKLQQKKAIIVKDNDNSLIKIYNSDIYYIEKKQNYTFFYTIFGIFKTRQSLKQTIKSLDNYIMLQASSGTYINPNYLEKILSTSIIVNKIEMPLSRRRKQQFIQEYMQYLSNRNKL